MNSGRGGVARDDHALVTVRTFEHTFRQLSIRSGGVLLVHASLSSLGFVLNGVETLRVALRRALGPEGTLLVPTFTGDLTDPACWVDPALPAAVWDEVRAAMPAFDRERTLPASMGQLAASVLMDPASRRSEHPLCSFAALGPRAEELVADHDLRDPFGLQSPLARARALDAQVLLVGVDQRKNAALLHAHCMSDAPQVRRNKGPFLAEIDGRREWITPLRLAECGEGFVRIEDDLVARGLVRVARAGDGLCRAMWMQPTVALVQHLLRMSPEAVLCGRASCRQCSG